jgi:general secretion pathway protein E
MNRPGATLEPQAVRAALAAARQRAKASGGSVLDELRKDPQADSILERSGVDAFHEASQVATASPLSLPLGQAVLVTTDGGGQRLLMADPWDETLLSQAHAKLGRYVEPAAASTALMARWSDKTEPPMLSAEPRSGTTTSGRPSEGSVVAFVDDAITQAYRTGASDVHFECDRRGVSAKFRLDGVMTPFARMDGVQQAEEAISRIKVLAQLDITERRLPQDGRFRFGRDGVGLDLRVSIMPSVFGEDAVLRLLDKSQLRSQDQQVSLDALGFEAVNARAIRWLANLPNGMLLVTGPTGSGKTTTVYATLSEINTGLEKIITIEDPVEYELPGVLQIPVNERKGLTFAKGLRSILRHDPDRILVGEIRDADTAEIAVQSSLTGHLVFTTVHANSLFDVIGRFKHFGIDMFGFVSSLNGVVVQRLMRRLCSQCSGTRAANADEAAWLAKHGCEDLAQSLPNVVGCDACHHTGYRGRFVVAEVHSLSDAMRDLIMRQADVTELKKMAFSGEVLPLLSHGLNAVRERRTSIEELFRVVGQV